MIENHSVDYAVYVETIEELHKRWTPHGAQIKIGKAFFNDLKQYVFAKCGRNFGKTELICYLLWRYARLFPGSENYYFAPYAKQAFELTWASRRLQDFGPREWLKESSKGVNNSEHRLNFTNDSFIKLDGADNVDSYRGIKPKGLVVYDEYKDFKPEFHEAMDPNFAAHKSPVFIVGTPPEIEMHHFYDLEEEFKTNDEKSAFEFTSFENPHLDHDWLHKKKEELYRRGDGDQWEREYMVKKVFGGKNSIFPMLDKDRHVMPHKQLMQSIKNDMRKLQFVNASDPGTVACFGVLFACMNPYTRKIYLLDNIYEKEQKNTVTSNIGRRLLETERDLNSREEWGRIYDDAASWFQNEFVDQFDENMLPAHKHLKDKEEGLSLIKDMLLYDMLVISDRCNELLTEMFNYVKDKNGKIPKENDHLIDCLRYLLGYFHYDMNHVKEQRNIEIMNKENKPYYKMEEDFSNEMTGWEDSDEFVDEGTF